MLLKEWQHYALVSPRWFVSVALFNSKRVSLVHVVVYDRAERRKLIFERKVPPWDLEIPGELWNGRASYQKRGLSIVANNRLAEGRHEIEFSCAAQRASTAVTGSFVCHEDLP